MIVLIGIGTVASFGPGQYPDFGSPLSLLAWWVIPVLILVVGSILVTLVLVLIRPHMIPKADKVDFSEVIHTMGGESNLVKASLDGSRMTLWLRDQAKCDFNRLKELGASGIFISGGTVKFLWPNEPNALVDEIHRLTERGSQ